MTAVVNALDLLLEAESDLLGGLQYALNTVANAGKLDAAGLSEDDIGLLTNALYTAMVPVVRAGFEQVAEHRYDASSLGQQFAEQEEPHEDADEE